MLVKQLIESPPKVLRQLFIARVRPSDLRLEKEE
jgi:hypothetical protein